MPTISELHRKRAHQQHREAEGYMELITAVADCWLPEPAIRRRIARRALDLLERIEATEYYSGGFWYLKGQALGCLGRDDEAIPALRRATELMPDHPGAWVALGACYREIHRIDLAVEALEEALVAEPSSACVRYDLACYWSLAGNVELAAESLSQAVQIDPHLLRLVAEDPDFDPVRHDPAFQAVASVIV